MDCQDYITESVERKKGQHLQREERGAIQHLKNAGYTNRAIARAIGCSPTTVGNELKRGTPPRKSSKGRKPCALPGFVDSKNEEKTERNAGYLVVSHSGGGMLRQGTRKGIRRTPANRGMRAHRIVKSLDISEDVCHGLCP